MEGHGELERRGETRRAELEDRGDDCGEQEDGGGEEDEGGGVAGWLDELDDGTGDVGVLLGPGLGTTTMAVGALAWAESVIFVLLIMSVIFPGRDFLGTETMAVATSELVLGTRLMVQLVVVLHAVPGALAVSETLPGDVALPLIVACTLEAVEAA